MKGQQVKETNKGGWGTQVARVGKLLSFPWLPIPHSPDIKGQGKGVTITTQRKLWLMLCSLQEECSLDQAATCSERARA